MTSSVHSEIKSWRFAKLCAANWLLHIFVFAQLPLLSTMCDDRPYTLPTPGLLVLAFVAGMLAAGPFGAHVVERHSRKGVYVRSVLALSLMPAAGMSWFNAMPALMVVWALQGVCYGLSQIAMGATLINDLLPSDSRTQGDNIYAWAARLGMPVGLAVGFFLTIPFPPHTAAWWLALAGGAACLLVIQTPVRIKAPVPTPLLSLDRFFLPSAWRTVAALVPAAWGLGTIVSARGMHILPIMSMAVGCVVAWGLSKILKRLTQRPVFIASCYAVLIAAEWLGRSVVTADAMPGAVAIPAPFTTIETACLCLVSASLLSCSLHQAAHCQRGTVQNTHLLSWWIAFSWGMM